MKELCKKVNQNLCAFGRLRPYLGEPKSKLLSNSVVMSNLSFLVFRDDNINEIEKQLNKNFNSLCDWFVDNKLRIHFGEDKTKSILLDRKNKPSGSKKLDIRGGDITIKQYTSVTYLGCVLDENLSG